MSNSVLEPEGVSTLEYIVTHVFFPLQLPDEDDQSVRSDRSLAGAIATAAHLYAVHGAYVVTFSEIHGYPTLTIS